MSKPLPEILPTLTLETTSFVCGCVYAGVASPFSLIETIGPFISTEIKRLQAQRYFH